MVGEFDPAIQRLVDDIRKADEKVREQKRMVNQLCEYADREPIYLDVENASGASATQFRPDQFYGKPLSTAIRDYLEARKSAGLGAATVREIFAALQQGGFKFDAKDSSNAQRGMRQSLTKNSSAFHKLPNGTYGLREWYPNVRPARQSSQSDEKSADDVGTSSADNAYSSDVSQNSEGLETSEPTNERG